MFVAKCHLLLYIAGLLIVVPVLVHAAPLQPKVGILTPYTDSQFAPAEQTVFKFPLPGLKLDKRISHRGLNNKGIYSVAGVYKDSAGKVHAGKDLVAKIVLHDAERTWAEVKALKKKGQFVASGQVGMPDGSWEQVIVMQKLSGEVLVDNDEYKQATQQEKMQMTKQAIQLLCEEVAKEAVDLQMYHADNNMQNVLVIVANKKIVSAQIVDYDGDFVYDVKQGAQKANIKRFCVSSVHPESWTLQDPKAFDRRGWIRLCAMSISVMG
ncbi:hypothetical protein GYMLUDRAFT_99440 [Collybiopsis luxurians FD-317 M1]|uniref:Protein kinase domain-containing protein n=1 Tax=Collybiopsis luxurians FD-317 M1 TaxID=944289 RepID=A0A0D0CKJ9_9AGAR|nr:hypothetical protein GYMLUDRAFT_99440 [Collybiopsis luxurians FD-317 M1]